MLVILAGRVNGLHATSGLDDASERENNSLLVQYTKKIVGH